MLSILDLNIKGFQVDLASLHKKVLIDKNNISYAFDAIPGQTIFSNTVLNVGNLLYFLP